MPIVASDIKFYKSNSALCIGSSITVTEVNPATLFDVITSAQSASGITEYRGIYVKNTHATLTLTAVKAFLQAESSPGVTHSFGWHAGGTGMALSERGNETEAPVSVTFSSNTSYADGQATVDIPAGYYVGMWIRRVVAPGAAAGTKTFTIRVQGDSAP
jgi:hypothetical protein